MSAGSTSAFLCSVVAPPATIAGAVPEDAKELKHHLKDGKGFRNPWESYRTWGAFRIMRTMIWRHVTGKGKFPDTTPPTVTVHKPNFLSSRETSALRATWLGHASYYIEFPGGFRVLTDPVLTSRCSPFSFMGPKRYTGVPCQIEDIPAIDAVVISHNHYDHLSHPTVMKIKELHPNAHMFVPLNNKQWFISCGFKEDNVTELDWWEERNIELTPVPLKDKTENEHEMVLKDGKPKQKEDEFLGITATIGLLPCQHTSARSPFDKDHALWGSWSIESGGKKVYFAGDTGYRSVNFHPPGFDDYNPTLTYPHCPAFSQIGKFRGPFDLGLIPIGAYEPRFVMSPMHANPFDAVNIFLDTRCKRALSMHWGTWVLTEEEVLEPPRKLREALRWKGVPEEGVFDIVDLGESREFSGEGEWQVL